ncbi:MAG TPA: HAMP domain-containing sensor histidine kinase [Nocardioides sp.]|nr:HAMP domain-containing sensor histidine kinase [Nocardioides sp.]
MRRLGRLPLRVRLVAGFVVAMLVLLIGAGAFVYWRVQYALDRQLDAELTQATDTIDPLIAADGRVRDTESADATGAAWQVLDADGEVLASGGRAPDRALVSGRDLPSSGARTVDTGDFLPASSKPYRLRITTLGSEDGRAAYLVVGLRRDHRDEALRELVVQLTLAGTGSLLVAAVVGDLLARASLRPVERYRRRAAEIAAGAGGLRLDVPAGRDDEVTRLGHTLNDMLAALEDSLDRERRFIDDASHELRTPLTLLKSRIQLARRRSRDVAEHERVLDELAVDVSRLIDLAEQLLEVGPARRAPEGSADVGRAVSGVVERRRLARPEQAHQLSVELPLEPVRVGMDEHALQRVVTNLLENAFVHGSPPVRIAVAARGEHVVLQVTDGGPGIPPDLLGRATARFTRASDARSRPGTGLGLALVEQLVTEAGGELRLCAGGDHAAWGPPAPVPCDHGGEMTATVLLRAASPPGSAGPSR